MKLAREVAHTLDVDGMLDSITPQQFDEWMAEYLIEPWDGAEIKRAGSLEDSLNTFRGLAGA